MSSCTDNRTILVEYACALFLDADESAADVVAAAVSYIDRSAFVGVAYDNDT